MTGRRSEARADPGPGPAAARAQIGTQLQVNGDVTPAVFIWQFSLSYNTIFYFIFCVLVWITNFIKTYLIVSND